MSSTSRSSRSTSELCTPSIEAMWELRVCVSYAAVVRRAATRTRPREPQSAGIRQAPSRMEYPEWT